MTEFAPVSGIVGGALIGLAAVLMLGAIGRIAGVTGILRGVPMPGASGDRSWRIGFLSGLPVGLGLTVLAGVKDLSSLSFPANEPVTALAGLLAGFGAVWGSGCTSGHGVCGLAMFSARSAVATVVFMLTGALTVFVVRHVL